jgi:DeoR family ulaG and ulaABCDEF operon transcriptional repressor
MHAAEREQLILDMLRQRGFVRFQEIDQRIQGSQATLRRDLDRLERDGKIERVRGGARLAGHETAGRPYLAGVPFQENIGRNRAQKEAIGRAAAQLCRPGESVIIDGGSTTLQMCHLLGPLGLHVLTNSLHIVSALLPQVGTNVSVPAGTLFREQNIILSPFADDGMERYHASKLFMGAAAIGPHGLMQTDVLLVQVERRLLDRADEVVILIDSSKFEAPTGHAVCALQDIDLLITDSGITDKHAKMLEKAGVKLIVAEDR